ALGPRPDGLAVLSLGSVEATRRNGAPPPPLSLEIAEAEREAAGTAACVLTPDWLKERATRDLGLDGGRVVAFPMEGRLPNEWECRPAYGQGEGASGGGAPDRVVAVVGHPRAG